MVGLKGGGKTTMYNWIKDPLNLTLVNYIRFDIKTTRYKDMHFTIFDLGNNKLRPLWRHYYSNINAIIFVIDSNDRYSISNDNIHSITAKNELLKLLNEEQIADDLPLLILSL